MPYKFYTLRFRAHMAKMKCQQSLVYKAYPHYLLYSASPANPPKPLALLISLQ